MLKATTNFFSRSGAVDLLGFMFLIVGGAVHAETAVLSDLSDGSEQRQEIYWIEPGPEAQIRVSQRLNDEWLPAQEIHRSKNACASLAIISDLAGTKYLIWSEKTKTRTQLMLSTKAKDDNKWGEARVLSNYGRENNGATMVLDPSNIVWLFWSSNSGGLDDIYMRKKTDQEWSERVRIHEPNNVPDIKPSAIINNKGEVQVDWTKYDLEIGQYVGAVQYFELDSPQNSGYNLEPKRTKDANSAVKDVELPAFLSDRAISPLRHFPDLLGSQSLRLR